MECSDCKKIYKNIQTLRKHSKICKKKIKTDKIINKFILSDYLEYVDMRIEKIINDSKCDETLLEDLLLNMFIKSNKEKVNFAKKLKHLQMNIGKIWQIVLGNYKDFIDLEEGDETGLDVKSDKLKIIMEIKNRYNTDNASSRKTNYGKLSNFKLNNPDYECIYAVINEKHNLGNDYIIKHNEQNIRYLSGQKLLDYVFANDKNIIIDTITKKMSSII